MRKPFGVFGDLIGTFGNSSVSKVPMARPAVTIFLLLTLNFVNMAQVPQTPNMEAQRAAMKKLDFLVGEWSGQASVARGGVIVELEQSEVAQFKLDGLVLMVEGIGRTKSDGKVVLQALGLITFDDTSGSYRMRAYNDGRCYAKIAPAKSTCVNLSRSAIQDSALQASMLRRT